MNKPLSPKDFQADDAAAPEAQAEAAAAAATKAKRKKLFATLAVAALTIGAGVGAWQVLVASHYAETDNAYVGTDSAQVTPRIEGAVAQVTVGNTQVVKAGDILVVLDQSDAKLQLAEAEAALAQAERRVRGWMANDRSLSAQIAARQADQTRAKAQSQAAFADLERARIEYANRSQLEETGAISAEEFTRSVSALKTAQAAYAQARAAEAQALANRGQAVGALEANQVLTAGAGVTTNPEVTAARARYEKSRLQLERTVIRAPVSGVVTGRQVQVGQRIQPGSVLMTVVPVQQAYVDANFKEGQLAKVRPGQPVELVSDLYGDGVKFHGKVVGMSGGTGSAFALIPAQNATGNWIKVVQRVPVRVQLDPAELAKHPLRVGLSMKATIKLS
jgi:membrane fusion protein (multidrug efflux system)